MKHSRIIKDFLLKTGLMRISRQLERGSTVAILRYHAVVSEENNYYASPGICLPPEVFERQVVYLSRSHNIVPLDTVAECLKNGKKFPSKAVVLTFDDGYRDNYYASKIMKKYGATGTFYICAGCLEQKETLWLFEIIYLISHTKRMELRLDVNREPILFSLQSNREKKIAIQSVTELIKSNTLQIRESIREQLRTQLQDVTDVNEAASNVMMTWDEVCEMTADGMSIGGHTMTHLNLPNARTEDASREIRECKKVIEDRIGSPVRHFSYPNGGKYAYYNQSVMKMVKDANFETATTSNNGIVNMHSNPLELKRIRVTSHLSEILYQIDCEPLINKIKLLSSYS